MSTIRIFAAVAVLLVSACSSTPVVSPPRPRDPGTVAVPVQDLANRHGLRESYEVRQNRLLLSGAGHRVLLFPGTTVAVVNGERVPEMGKIEGTSGSWVLSRDDAERIEIALGNRSIPVHTRDAVRNGPGARPAPEKVPAPSTGLTAEPGWRVPLARAWEYIIIHHSGTTSGSAASFHRNHRAERGWDGLGYDFVIGNGRGAPDGRVEVGYRWSDQLTGAHAGRAPDGSNRMNEAGIGICLVGNFDKGRPTTAQMDSLSRLIAFLRSYCGIPEENVLLHADVRDTVCPGKHFPATRFVRAARRAALPSSLK